LCHEKHALSARIGYLLKKKSAEEEIFNVQSARQILVALLGDCVEAYCFCRIPRKVLGTFLRTLDEKY
jgi:hypothetical protein